MNSTELRGFLTGLILGDGTIDKGTTKRSFYIRSINKEFIDMIDCQLQSVSGFKIVRQFTPEHYSCGCNHKDNWGLRIKAHPYFSKIYHEFYDDYRKRIITPKCMGCLNEFGLANWYMSDGYVCLVGRSKGFIRDRRIDFCTDRYKLSDVEYIRWSFKDKFDLNTSLIKRDNFYRIRIAKDSYNNFFEIIEPYIVDTMKYKLYLGYDNRQDWMSDKVWELQENLKSAALFTA